MRYKPAPITKMNPLENKINHILLYSYVESYVMPVEAFMDVTIRQLDKIYGVNRVN